MTTTDPVAHFRFNRSITDDLFGPYVVGVDLDDTGFNFRDTLLQYLVERYNSDHQSTVAVSDFAPSHSWNWWKAWPELFDLDPADPDFDAKGNVRLGEMLIDAVRDWDFYAKCPPEHGFGEAMHSLADAGADYAFVSHRNFLGETFADRVGDRRDWTRMVTDQTMRSLDAVGLDSRHVHWTGHKSRVSCQLYLDDSPGQVAKLRSDGKTVGVFSQPHNHDLPGLRFFSWSSVVPWVMKDMSLRHGAQVALGHLVEHQASGRISYDTTTPVDQHLGGAALVLPSQVRVQNDAFAADISRISNPLLSDSVGTDL
jgi:hypothetical protein